MVLEFITTTLEWLEVGVLNLNPPTSALNLRVGRWLSSPSWGFFWSQKGPFLDERVELGRIFYIDLTDYPEEKLWE